MKTLQGSNIASDVEEVSEADSGLEREWVETEPAGERAAPRREKLLLLALGIQPSPPLGHGDCQDGSK